MNTINFNVGENNCYFDYKNLALKIGEHKIDFNIIESNEKSRLYLIFSKTCNLCCDYCFQKNDDKRINAIEKSTRIYEILDQVIDKYDDIVLFGGEPLLETNYKIIENIFFKYPHKDYIIFSNGTFEKSYIHLLEKYRKSIKGIILTLDGPKATHDLVRYNFKNGKKEGTYKVIVENAKKLVDGGINCEIQINCTLNNLNKIDDMLEELSREFLDEVMTIMLNPVKYSEYDLKHIDLLKLYIRNKHKYENLNICINSRLANNLNSIITEKKYDNRRCNVDNTMIIDFSTGKVYKCPQNENSMIGKICDDSIEYYPKTEDEYSLKSNYKNDECKECGLNKFCYFGCANNKNDYSLCKQEVLSNLEYAFEHFESLFELEENYE